MVRVCKPIIKFHTLYITRHIMTSVLVKLSGKALPQHFASPTDFLLKNRSSPPTFHLPPLSALNVVPHAKKHTIQHIILNSEEPLTCSLDYSCAFRCLHFIQCVRLRLQPEDDHIRMSLFCTENPICEALETAMSIGRRDSWSGMRCAYF